MQSETILSNASNQAMQRSAIPRAETLKDEMMMHEKEAKLAFSCPPRRLNTIDGAAVSNMCAP
jgi:hypothetical protein